MLENDDDEKGSLRPDSNLRRFSWSVFTFRESILSCRLSLTFPSDNVWQKNQLLSTKLFSHHSPALSVFFSRMFQNSSPNSNRFLVKLSGRTGLCKSYYRSFWFGLHQTSYFSILDLTNKFWIDLLILMQNTFSVYLRKWTLWADFMIHLLEQNTKT